MLKVIVLALVASLTGFGQVEADTKTKAAVVSVREAGLAKAVERQELHHFELHHFFIPATQGNLQWLAAQVGARPDEALVVWKLMRDWDATRAARTTDSTRNPS